MNIIYLNIFSYLISLIIIQSVLFYNKYPLVQGDSAGYIVRAFSKEVNHHWALFYSFFIYFSSLNISLFFVVFLQNILSLAVLSILTYKLLDKNHNIYLVILVSLLTLVSSLPYLSNLLMSDIFTSLGLISLSALIFLNLTRFSTVFFCVILGFSLIAHNSHLPIFLGVLLLNIVIFLVFNGRLRDIKGLLLNVATVLVVIVIALEVINPIVQKFFIHIPENSIVDASENISDSKYHFVWTKLYKSEHYNYFTEQYCPQKKYTYLCDNNFLEKIQNRNVLKKMFHGNNEAFLKEIEDAGRVIVHDGHLMWIIFKSRIKGVFYLLKNNKLKNGYVNKELLKVIPEHFSYDRKMIVQSESFNKKLFSKPYMVFLENKNIIVLILSSFLSVFLLLFFAYRNVYSIQTKFLLSLVGCHFVNVFLMGLFAKVENARYCYRTSWLVVLVALYLLMLLFQYSLKPHGENESITILTDNR